MTLYLWNRTASGNGTADASSPWPEGMAPSQVNDSARGMMAAVAKYRDDSAGLITTGGTSTNYTVSSFQAFDTLAHLHGQTIAFTPHATNGATVTLNVDGLGAKPLRTAPNAELLAGVLIQGTPYIAVYNNSDNAFYLRGVFGNPLAIPLGASVDYWGSSAPNSSLALMYGQALSRTTYAALFSLLSTTYGAGDGTTTFNIPDLRGRVIAGKDDMGGSAASRLTSTFFGTSAAALGAVGGAESHTLQTTEIPSHTHNNTLTDPGHTHGTDASKLVAGLGAANGTGNTSTPATNNSATTGITINNAAAGGGGAHKNVQPTIIGNKLLRII